MWSLFAARPFDSLSTRRFTVFLLAIIMALFSLTALYSTPAQAQTTPDRERMATWSGDNLEYDGNPLNKVSGDQTAFLNGTVCEGNENSFVSQVLKGDWRNDGTETNGVFVICLDEGEDTSDKSQPIEAQLVTYVGPLTSTRVSEYDRLEPRGVTVAPLGTDGLGNSGEDGEPATSCDSTYTYGIGWIICPVTNFLASGMDKLFDVLTQFLIVEPLSSDQDSVLYNAWGFMRNLANVLFVLGFLIIIYSQITSLGLSNYGIKRLLPRLVIAAVLVNISYWIAAVAVDLSNILGVAFQEMFISMRNSLDTPNSGDWQLVSWESIAGFILSGGAIAAGLGVVGAGLVTAGTGATIILLLPILMGVIMAALVAVLILAARQALITVLIILAPLACVAYLLPNTEKYFERWRELFTTMLLVFPLFSIVFGGAQLAGTAIILTAAKSEPGPNNINMVLLGMAVQVAPIVITPLLIKLSGSLLGRLAGMVNNPNKGLIDRTRNFANERAGLASARRLGARNEDGSFRHNWPATRLARRLQYSKQGRAGGLKAYESSVEAGFANTDAAHRIHATSGTAHLHKERGEKEAEYLFNEAVRSTAGLQTLDLESRLNQQRAANSKTLNDITAARVTARPDLIGDTAAGMAAVAIANQMQENMIAERNLGHRLNIDKRGQESAYNTALLADQNLSATATAEERAAAARAVELRREAADIGVDPTSETRILNIVQEAETKERETRISAGNATLGREEATVDELVALTLGRVPASGRFANFATDNDSRSAALRRLVKTAPEFAVLDAMEQLNLSRTASLDPTEALIRSEFAAAITERKPFMVSAGVLNQMAEGRLDPAYNGPSGRNRMIAETLNNFALDANAMVTADRDDLKAVATFFSSPEAAALTPEARNRMIRSFDEAFNPDGLYEGKMGKRRLELNEIRVELGLPPIT